MSTRRPAPSVDHYLVARAQGRITGQNAHDVHALLGLYLVLSDLAPEDAECHARLVAIEQRLRAFCQTGALSR